MHRLYPAIDRDRRGFMRTQPPVIETAPTMRVTPHPATAAAGGSTGSPPWQAVRRSGGAKIAIISEKVEPFDGLGRGEAPQESIDFVMKQLTAERKKGAS